MLTILAAVYIPMTFTTVRGVELFKGTRPSNKIQGIFGMNVTEINGAGSIPHYYHVIAVGIPLVLLTIVVPLISGTMIRLVMSIMASHIAATVALLLAWCIALTLYVFPFPGSPSMNFSLLPASAFLLFCSWKAVSHFKQRNRNDVVVYVICACMTPVIALLSFYPETYALSFPLAFPLLPFLWGWAHRKRIMDWMAKRRAR